MSDIQVLVTDDGNRQALTSVLEDHHTPVTDLEVQAVDLFLVDDASFPQYRKALAAHKREQAPVFCPVVLIRRDQTSIKIELPEPDVDDRPFLINEVVNAPVEQEALLRTIANLLVRREQTKELRATNEQLEQFASTLRHELRNPLQILMGNLKPLHENNDDEIFERCQTAIRRMDRLLDDTLLLVQGEQSECDPEPVDLSSLAEECWEMVSDQDAHLTIATDQRIYADKDRLKQLFENLCRNAVEHGGSEVTVTVGDLADGFYVEDDGVGIPQEERERVCQEGYSTESAGTGLGLAVVQAIVDAHGWELHITVGDEGGARFEITGVNSEQFSYPPWWSQLAPPFRREYDTGGLINRIKHF